MNKRQRRLEGIKRARRMNRVYRQMWRNTLPEDVYSEESKWFKKTIHTRVPCSCSMCGHRRETMGRTYQEVKADLELWEESKDPTV